MNSIRYKKILKEEEDFNRRIYLLAAIKNVWMNLFFVLVGNAAFILIIRCAAGILYQFPKDKAIFKFLIAVSSVYFVIFLFSAKYVVDYFKRLISYYRELRNK